MTEISAIAQKLDFMDNPAAQYEVAAGLVGCEFIDAAVSGVRIIWSRKEAELHRQLRSGRSETAIKGKSYPTDLGLPAAGRRPDRMPTDKEEFDALGYSERVWIFTHDRQLYDRFVGKNRT